MSTKIEVMKLIEDSLNEAIRKRDLEHQKKRDYINAEHDITIKSMYNLFSKLLPDQEAVNVPDYHALYNNTNIRFKHCDHYHEVEFINRNDEKVSVKGMRVDCACPKLLAGGFPVTFTFDNDFRPIHGFARGNVIGNTVYFDFGNNIDFTERLIVRFNHSSDDEVRFKQLEHHCFQLQLSPEASCTCKGSAKPKK